jgi:cytochrome c556
MRRLLTHATILFVALAGTVAMAQQVTNPEQLDAAMKRVVAANGAANKAIKSGAYADARTQIAAVKQALMDAQNFWVMNKKDDAIQIGNAAIAGMTAVEEALSASSPSTEAVMAAMKQATGNCGACHKQYRVQNDDMSYSLRPGAI